MSKEETPIKKEVPTKKEELSNKLQDTLEELQKEFGEGAVMRLKDVHSVNVDSIPTGSMFLDSALGSGGIPKGRIVEIYGPESSGKSTLALHCAAQAQKAGGICAFIDAEHALDPEYAKKLGVKVEELIISQPDSGEQGLQIVESLVRSEQVDLIIVDSVAALVPKREIAGDIGDQHIGLQARLMSQGLRKLSGIASKSNTAIIFLNQTRMKIGVMFGSPETTPGGLALKFYASVRIRLARRAQIKQGEDIIGSRIKAKIVKNKVAAPFKIAEFDIYYNEGISHIADVINGGLAYDIIKKSGAWFSYDGSDPELKGAKLGQGMPGAKEFLKENPKVVKQIKKELKEKMK
jgi:recombination protein RecA